MAKKINRSTRLWASAMHEAGHAVIHCFLGIPDLREVSIEQKKNSLGRMNVFSPQTFDSELGRKIYLRKRAVICMAGFVFEEMARKNHRAEPSDTDLLGCIEAASFLKEDVPEEPTEKDLFFFWLEHPFSLSAIRRAKWLRDKTGLGSIVSQFATELYFRRTIDGRSAMTVIDDLLGRNENWLPCRWDRENAKHKKNATCMKVVLIDGQTLTIEDRRT